MKIVIAGRNGYLVVFYLIKTKVELFYRNSDPKVFIKIRGGLS